ncbi:MAG TPA: glutamate--cysteine ligase [Actinophytocola sp.]|uniref:carboxylate-amine ligase n=1 Tax=Actinophytocola sp. TaxID=1872138 RepID=UPI002DB94E5A|nr:glutamate--cysteine ligase [Actinophytocola sp.]HEU5474922.1 glutamate--cysteine ligase [Actinophytocola sp.]
MGLSDHEQPGGGSPHGREAEMTNSPDVRVAHQPHRHAHTSQRMTTAPTLGVEEEYLLVDETTKLPVPVGSTTVAELSDVDFHREFSQAQTEFATPVCTGLDDLRQQLLRGRRTLAKAARHHGAMLVATGAPPLGRPGPPPVTGKPRYQRMVELYGALTDDQGMCGCHVHIGVPDLEHAVRASNHLRPWLPALLVLGANSPFFDGRDTGHASWRTNVWARWPVAAVPPHFRCADEYDALVSRLVAAEVILDDSMVYWYIRPSRHAPTVEVRVADVSATVEEAVLQAALTRALVTTALEEERPSPGVPDVVLRAACWRAALVGLEGRCLDPFTASAAPGWDLVDTLLAHVRPVLSASGDLDMVMSCLSWLRAHGGGATRQRAALRTHGDLRAVVDILAVARDGRP